MKIAVLNGSPKGDLSVTMQYVKFISKKYPDHEFVIIPVGNRIKQIEKDASIFDEIINRVKESDCVIFATPVYVALVPSQYKRFIELVFERNAADAFAGKTGMSLTTSIHWYDHTAHNYLAAVAEDMGMRWAGFYSADMYDIMKEDNRQKLIDFMNYVFLFTTEKFPFARQFTRADRSSFVYEAGEVTTFMDAGDLRILIVTDSRGENPGIDSMIKRFTASIRGRVETAGIHELTINGGCLGCCECGLDYRCVYTGKDDFIDFYNSRIKTADIIIFAGTLRDRYLSAKFKEFFDRGFFNTHTPTLVGKQLGFLISGPLNATPNIREILQAFSEWQHANLAGIVTDETADKEQIDGLVTDLAHKAVRFTLQKFIKPPTFLGVGGMKVFRDDIWGRLRFVFQADHEFYEKNGFYDFPQDDAKTKDINEKMIAFSNMPDMRDKFRRMIKTEMVKPHQYIAENK